MEDLNVMDGNKNIIDEILHGKKVKLFFIKITIFILRSCQIICEYYYLIFINIYQYKSFIGMINLLIIFIEIKIINI